MTALEALGFAFTWWARVTLGAYWSGDVSRKADHRIIDTGPYRIVRHPIYTGLLLATYATAAQIAAPTTLAGIALVTLALWIKARLEERFLVQELGEAAYEPYRRRTPMLAPFSSWRG
jgi:protein-S-isoprenylcysteine O-methyltransferase Ste14